MASTSQLSQLNASEDTQKLSSGMMVIWETTPTSTMAIVWANKAKELSATAWAREEENVTNATPLFKPTKLFQFSGMTTDRAGTSALATSSSETNFLATSRTCTLT